MVGSFRGLDVFAGTSFLSFAGVAARGGRGFVPVLGLLLAAVDVGLVLEVAKLTFDVDFALGSGFLVAESRSADSFNCLDDIEGFFRGSPVSPMEV